MPYARKLSSVHVISIMEHLGKLGRIEIPYSRPDETIVFSAGFLDLFGLDKADTVSLDLVVRALHSADRGVFIEDIGAMRRGQEPPKRTYRLVTPLPHSRHVTLQFESLLGENGDIQRFVGLARDVSAEEATLRAKNRRSSRVDALMTYLGAECLWSADANGRLFEHFTKGNLEGVVPYFGPIAPSSVYSLDREIALAAISRALAAGKAFSVTLRIYGADGVVRRYCKKGFPIYEKARLVEWWGFIIEDRALVSLAPMEIHDAVKQATGATLRALCALEGWTHNEMAHKAGTSRATIYRMASSSETLLGQFKYKTIEAVLKIFTHSGVRFFLDPEGVLAFSHKYERK